MRVVLLIFLFSFQGLFAFPQYYCTGANSLYFVKLLNLIGSIHETNYDSLKEIAVFDLGLSADEIETLKKIRKVAVYQVEKTHPDMLNFFKLPNGMKVLGWFAWKPVAIKQALDRFPYVLWIDAGATILKNLDPLFQYIDQKGYFLGTVGDETDSQGRYLHPLRWGMTTYVKKYFKIPDASPLLEKESVMGCVIGVSKQGRTHFLDELYELSKDLRNYQDDGTTPNGWGTARHDQIPLSLLAYTRNLVVHKQFYTQQKPIQLDEEHSLYITWHSAFVNEATSIYNSRTDLKRAAHYLAQIRKK